MNTFRLFNRCRALLALAFVSIAALPTASSAAVPTSDPQTLHVQVQVPADWAALNTFRLEDDFVYAISQILGRNGFALPVEHLASAKRGEETPYVLTINLIEWRMGRTGIVDCTLSANLETPRGTRQLGTYHASGFHMRGMGRWAVAQEFDDTASEALHKLCRDILRTELLPIADAPAA